MTFTGRSHHGDDPQAPLRQGQRTGAPRRAPARLGDVPERPPRRKPGRARSKATSTQGKHYGYSRVRTLADAIDAFTKQHDDDQDRRRSQPASRLVARALTALASCSTSPATWSSRAARSWPPRTSSRTRSKPARHRAPQTVRHYLMSLSACMDYAKRKKRWIEKNPVSDVDAPPVSPGRIRWLSADERKQLLAACDKSGNPDLALVVRIALASGARQAEIMHLRWPHDRPVARMRVPADLEDRRAARACRCRAQ